ncbi:hypothetical protein B0H21DRAFT_219834 [Amylocystis lapponica]|nr:hypothetical protein B0H21DRAFT_219834 [Amylocystis lapponica]
MSPHTSSVLESEQVEGPSSSPRSPQMALPTPSRSPSPLSSAASHARPLKLSRIPTICDPAMSANTVSGSSSGVSRCESYMSDQPMSSARILSLAQPILTLDVPASQTVIQDQEPPRQKTPHLTQDSVPLWNLQPVASLEESETPMEDIIHHGLAEVEPGLSPYTESESEAEHNKHCEDIEEHSLQSPSLEGRSSSPPAHDESDPETRSPVSSSQISSAGPLQPIVLSSTCMDSAPAAAQPVPSSPEGPLRPPKRPLSLHQEEIESAPKRRKPDSDTPANVKREYEETSLPPPQDLPEQDVLSSRPLKRPLLLPTKEQAEEFPHKRTKVGTDVKTEVKSEGLSLLARLGPRNTQPLDISWTDSISTQFAEEDPVTRQNAAWTSHGVPLALRIGGVQDPDVLEDDTDELILQALMDAYGWDWPRERSQVSRGGTRRTAQLKRQRAERELAALQLRYPAGVPQGLFDGIRMRHPGVDACVFAGVCTVRERRRVPQAAIDSIRAAVGLGGTVRPSGPAQGTPGLYARFVPPQLKIEPADVVGNVVVKHEQ